MTVRMVMKVLNQEKKKDKTHQKASEKIESPERMDLYHTGRARK